MSIFKYMPCEEELENLTESELIKRKKDSREKYLNLTNYAYDSENGKVYELLSDYKQTKDKSLLDEADDLERKIISQEKLYGLYKTELEKRQHFKYLKD